MLSLRNWHIVIGTLGLALFLLQGQYMARVLVLETLPDWPRLMYRTAHIYLMLASTANIWAGVSLPASIDSRLRQLCSILLLLGPPLLLASFFIESDSGEPYRPIASYTLYLQFGAAALLVAHALFKGAVFDFLDGEMG